MDYEFAWLNLSKFFTALYNYLVDLESKTCLPNHLKNLKYSIKVSLEFMQQIESGNSLNTIIDGIDYFTMEKVGNK